MLDTGHPPTWSLPHEDVRVALRRSSAGPTVCEWKGVATSWDEPGADGALLPAAAGSDERPTEPFKGGPGTLGW
ncbi:DUF427 domain-containing protein [Nakamurella sp. YIM 132084]|uniref:DUF427 domain-containing protein n=1 Tax=Nakamurella leprariae TaxID=2803911 RepID=A0A939C167_9ACTN|nr:DUF427 domain-containing protein [Nakamurella leprariae]